MPTFAFVMDSAASLQGLLGTTYMVLPPLSEVDAANHPVNCVVTYIRVQLSDERVQLGRTERTPSEQKQDRVGQDGLRRPSACALCQ